MSSQNTAFLKFHSSVLTVWLFWQMLYKWIWNWKGSLWEAVSLRCCDSSISPCLLHPPCLKGSLLWSKVLSVMILKWLYFYGLYHFRYLDKKKKIDPMYIRHCHFITFLHYLSFQVVYLYRKLSTYHLYLGGT